MCLIKQAVRVTIAKKGETNKPGGRGSGKKSPASPDQPSLSVHESTQRKIKK